uniref:G_PROTEIN_RECEP_F2_4 domain-containing protein n=1 Tax=Globodera pallida TaxID=36090 RepID=A0A183BZV8_GLOPA
MCCNGGTDMWMCCCCCQVTKGAQAVAWICLVAVLPFFSGIPIIVGELRGKPTHGMYLPFLVIFGIGFIVNLYAGIITLQLTKKAISAETGAGPMVLAFYALGWLLLLALDVWLYTIVLRAYFFVKRNNGHRGRDGNWKSADIAL